MNQDDKTIPGSLEVSDPDISTMLRPGTPADTPALLALAVATQLFGADEVEPLQAILDDLHAGRLGADHRLEVWADAPDDSPVGVVYFAPNDMTDRTWDLLWIAVAPDRQGQGIGSDLLRFSEAQVRAGSGRLLLIDTSSLPRFNATHAFYLKHGYAEVARVPDFYADGDSKVIFTKRMAQG
jgi:GNAT superfamily N-acetyltransferase